jgi:hypothetical protein
MIRIMGYLTCRPVYLYHVSHTICMLHFFKVPFMTTWKNIVRLDRQDMRQYLSTRFACCIPEDTNKPSEYVILTVFLLQQWLRQRAWVLPYAYASCTATADMNVRRWRACAWVSSCFFLSVILFNGSSCSAPLFVTYFMGGAVFEPQPGTSKYPPLVFHAVL